MSDSELMQRLREPFSPDEIEWKPQSVSGNRAMAIAYIDARCVQDRLDRVVGVAGWQDSYEVLDDGNVVCRLSLRINGEWIVKCDVGSPSDQKDVGDKRKASFSDALKRAAVKFGVGRYLYSLPGQWLDYDPQKRQLKGTPRLPDWALPAAKSNPKPTPAPTANGKPTTAPGLPANGTELRERVAAYDAKLSASGLCEPGELVGHVAMTLIKEGELSDWSTWSDKAIRTACDQVKWFETKRRQSQQQKAG